MNNNVTDLLGSLSNFQTNKDQTLGSVIAKAASLVAQEVREKSEPEIAEANDKNQMIQQMQMEPPRFRNNQKP
jgi:hypothetical protein